MCGILELLLFWRVATVVLSGWAVTFAVGLFSLGLPFVQFSSLVKRFLERHRGSDGPAACGCRDPQVGGHSRARMAPRPDRCRCGVVQPALFVLAGIAASFVTLVWTARDRPAARALTVTAVLWGVSATAAGGMFALRTVAAESRSSSDGSGPTASCRWMGLPDTSWVFLKLTWAFGSFGSGMGQMHGGLTYRWSPVFMLVMLAGLWALWKTRRDVALFLILPIVITAIASALKVYPFTARLFAFLLPGLLLATAAGANHLLSICPRPLSFSFPPASPCLAAHRSMRR